MATDVTDDTGLQTFLQKHAKETVNYEALSEVIDVVFGALKAHRAELNAAKSEIEKLRARPLQKWAGVHNTGTKYSEASLVTKGGSLWVATETTTTTPGESGSAWRLIVKKGHA